MPGLRPVYFCIRSTTADTPRKLPLLTQHGDCRFAQLQKQNGNLLQHARTRVAHALSLPLDPRGSSQQRIPVCPYLWDMAREPSHLCEEMGPQGECHRRHPHARVLCRTRASPPSFSDSLLDCSASAYRISSPPSEGERTTASAHPLAKGKAGTSHARKI